MFRNYLITDMESYFVYTVLERILQYILQIARMMLSHNSF